MIDNSSVKNKTKILDPITQIYKNTISNNPDFIIKEEENTINMQENQNISSNFLIQNEPKCFPIKIPNKKVLNKTALDKNKILKNYKKVTLNTPFISVILVESYKDCNLKMTYNEYDYPEIEVIVGNNKKFCPCKRKLCLIF